MGRGRGRRQRDIDWKSMFQATFSHDGAVGGSSNSGAPEPPAPAGWEPRNEFERSFGYDPGLDDDDGPYFARAPAPKARVGLGPDLPSAANGIDDSSQMDEDEQEENVCLKHYSKSSPKFSGEKKDGQADVGLGPDLPSASQGVYNFSPMVEDEQGEDVSPEHCSKLSPNSSGQKKNNGKNKRAHATGPEESDYESSLPSKFSERRKPRLQNSPSVHSRKVQYVVLLDDEDVEPKEELNREMSDRLNEQKIYYPSRDDPEALTLTRSDIKCLDPKVFLSSEVINFYIKYIQRTRLSNENFRDKFYMFNTYFFEKLEKEMYQPRDYPRLRRWWKSDNIFNNAYIILPIHQREHWSLVIICLPPKETISEPILLHLDSLGMHRSAKILNTVGRYLEKEWRFLSVADPEWPCLLSDIRKETVEVPQQNNSYDCGVFMLYYIEQFIKEAPGSQPTILTCWFKPEEASGLRQRMRELLLEEFESAARMDDAILEADACSDSMEDKKGASKTDPRSSKAEEEGKSNVIASLERLKLGTEEVIADSMPIPDAVTDSGVKREKGNEEVTGNMPVPDAFCEISGTKVWTKRVYRPTSGTTLEPGNWCWSNGGSSNDARRKFIEQFSRK